MSKRKPESSADLSIPEAPTGEKNLIKGATSYATSG
jgi:hypothetical protein